MTLAACFKKPVALQVLEEADDDLLVEIAQDRAMKVRERLAKKVVVSGWQLSLHHTHSKSRHKSQNLVQFLICSCLNLTGEEEELPVQLLRLGGARGG